MLLCSQSVNARNAFWTGIAVYPHKASTYTVLKWSDIHIPTTVQCLVGQCRGGQCHSTIFATHILVLNSFLLHV